MDRLEKFILENRTSFKEELKAPPHVWSAIEVELDQMEWNEKRVDRVKRTKVLRLLYRVSGVAASVAILIGAYALLAPSPKAHSTFDPEVVSVTSFYSQLISNRFGEAETTISSGLKEDILELREMQASILEEIDNAPESVRANLIQALRVNYENQLKVLESFEENKIKSSSIKSNNYESQDL